jgi:dimethylhistidine N-methyltransferase
MTSTAHLLRITPALPAASIDFARELIAGLQQRPKSVSPKFFYDAAGSALFEQICELPEYYPTRTEIGILTTHAQAIARCIGPRAEIVEFGAGSLRKLRLLLDALDEPLRYTPIDISGEHLLEAAAALRRERPQLDVLPVIADFSGALNLPPAPAEAASRVGFFPGSSIGNFAPDEALRLLQRMATWLAGGGLLIGVDLVKDPAELHAAYNDAAGVTAAFNLNLLVRANRELGADFELARFAHYAFYNPLARRIEMHLISRGAQTVHVAGERFEFADGESLHTENSYKYTVDGFRALAREAGFMPEAVWCDAAQRFAVHWLAAPRAQC